MIYLIIFYIIGIIVGYYGTRTFYKSWRDKYRMELFDIFIILIPGINFLLGIAGYLLRNKR
jgi:hypothetical protein